MSDNCLIEHTKPWTASVGNAAIELNLFEWFISVDNEIKMRLKRGDDESRKSICFCSNWVFPSFTVSWAKLSCQINEMDQILVF